MAGHVTDVAHHLDDGALGAADAHLRQIRDTTGRIAFLILDSLDGEPIEDVAYATAKAWRTGRGGRGDGIVVVIALADRRNPYRSGQGGGGSPSGSSRQATSFATSSLPRCGREIWPTRYVTAQARSPRRSGRMRPGIVRNGAMQTLRSSSGSSSGGSPRSSGSSSTGAGGETGRGQSHRAPKLGQTRRNVERGVELPLERVVLERHILERHIRDERHILERHILERHILLGRRRGLRRRRGQRRLLNDRSMSVTPFRPRLASWARSPQRLGPPHSPSPSRSCRSSSCGRSPRRLPGSLSRCTPGAKGPAGRGTDSAHFFST